MLRAILYTSLIACTLSAQTPEQQLKEAWDHYLQFDILGGPGKVAQAGLGEAMDELGRAWAGWTEWHGPSIVPLPAPMNFQRSDEPDTLTPPVNRVIAHRGPWLLMTLEVPAPCGTHLFVALFKAEDSQRRWKLAMLDLHEPRTAQDPLGAREDAQTLLLSDGKVVIASSPPWCTSCWSTLHARIEKPGTDTEHPKVLTTFEDGVDRCADNAFRMATVKGGIRLRYEGMAGQDGTTVPRMRLLRVP
jgi:hypothetical protein